MLGMRIETGGSKCAPAGCRVQAKGGAAPSGSAMGMSKNWTWFRETGVPSGAGAPPRDIEPALTRNSSPSMPATLRTVSWLVL